MTFLRMGPADVISACSRLAGLPFLVIGGLAVIHHGYARATADVDLLVCKADRDRWKKALGALGYLPFHEHDTFIQFSPPTGGFGLDIMLVSEATFDGLLAASVEANFGSACARVVSLEHLVALKLHVLKQGMPHRMLADMDDVIRLLLANGADLRSAQWKELFEKYGNRDLYERVLHAVTSH